MKKLSEIITDIKKKKNNNKKNEKKKKKNNNRRKNENNNEKKKAGKIRACTEHTSVTSLPVTSGDVTFGSTTPSNMVL